MTDKESPAIILADILAGNIRQVETARALIREIEEHLERRTIEIEAGNIDLDVGIARDQLKLVRDLMAGPRSFGGNR